jgi:hypothetical protein
VGSQQHHHVRFLPVLNKCGQLANDTDLTKGDYHGMEMSRMSLVSCDYPTSTMSFTALETDDIACPIICLVKEQQ